MKSKLMRVACVSSFFLMSSNLFAMQIFVKTMQGKSISIDVELEDSVASLKNKINEKEGVPPDQQRLVYNGKQLEDECNLKQYDVQADATIHLVLRLKGGEEENDK